MGGGTWCAAQPILCDANAVLHYILGDIPEQADETASAIRDGAEATIEVVAECVYVLARVYEIPKERIAFALTELLGEVTCRRRDVAISALRLYRVRKLDFVDCVFVAEASVNGRDVLTFDKKLKKLIASMGA